GRAVVNAIEGDVFQRTLAGIRGGRGPGTIDDAGVARGGHQEDSVERQSNRPRPADTPRTKPFCILSPHVHPFDPGNPTLRLTLRAHESLPILRLSTTEVSGGSKGCPGTRSGCIADSPRAGRSRRGV